MVDNLLNVLSHQSVKGSLVTYHIHFVSTRFPDNLHVLSTRQNSIDILFKGFQNPKCNVIDHSLMVNSSKLGLFIDVNLT